MFQFMYDVRMRVAVMKVCRMSESQDIDVFANFDDALNGFVAQETQVNPKRVQPKKGNDSPSCSFQSKLVEYVGTINFFFSASNAMQTAIHINLGSSFNTAHECFDLSATSI